LPNADFLGPRELEGRINLLPQAQESSMNSNVVIIDRSWSDYVSILEPKRPRPGFSLGGFFSAVDIAIAKLAYILTL
jgi:hypothetical protein